MRFRLTKPTPAFVVATAALLVSLGGTSYAVSQIGSADIRDGSIRSVDIRDDSVRSVDIKDGAVHTSDVADGSLLPRDFRPGSLPKGAPGDKGDKGEKGDKGDKGDTGPAGAGRWLLVDANGVIVAQSGGFQIRSAYDAVNNTGADIPAGAVGNVYIDANEDLSNNGIVVSIALQNQVEQDLEGTPGFGTKNGRAPAADANPEFSGEITATQCAISGVVACAPTGANTVEHFVVSPRLSDGQVTTSNNRKRFYVIITGDSSDYVPAA